MHPFNLQLGMSEQSQMCLQSRKEGDAFRSTRKTPLGLDGRGVSGGISRKLGEEKDPSAQSDSYGLVFQALLGTCPKASWTWVTQLK